MKLTLFEVSVEADSAADAADTLLLISIPVVIYTHSQDNIKKVEINNRKVELIS